MECNLSSISVGSFSLPSSRGSIPIKTPSGIVIALLAGRPYAPSWSEQMKSLAGDLNTTANSMTLETGGNRHHCGDYPAINIGVSYGGGSQVRAPYILEL